MVVPCAGVYGGFVTLANRLWDAAIHIGPNPTFEADGGQTKIEVHVIDFAADLYGQTLLVDFALHLRDIARFDSVEALSQQLTLDVDTIRTRLSSLRGDRHEG